MEAISKTLAALTVNRLLVPVNATTPFKPLTDCTAPFAANVVQLASVEAGTAVNIL